MLGDFQQFPLHFWKDSRYVLVGINVYLDIIHVNDESKNGVIKGGRKPHRVPQKSFQKPVFCNCDQTGGNGIMMGSMKKYEFELGIMSQPMVSVEPGIKRFLPPYVDTDIDRKQ